MSKSKSSSTTASTTTTTSSQASSDSFVTGDQLIGRDISIVEELPDAVVDIFGQLVKFADNSLSIAAGAGELAIEKVSDRQVQVEQPQQAILRDILPFATIIGGGILLYFVLRGAK